MNSRSGGIATLTDFDARVLETRNSTDDPMFNETLIKEKERLISTRFSYRIADAPQTIALRSLAFAS
jgi:hypothetical protein